jgi:hypothetical protein
MAFLDHIDPGNSGGSVPTPETPFKREIKPVVWPCSICGIAFKDQTTLSDHRIAEHPIKRPLLLINGQPLRKEQITVRSRITLESVSFQDVDVIYVDNNEVSSQKKLIEWLCSTSPASFELKLVNKTYPVCYRWTIDIASSDELDKIDKLFYGAFESGLETYQAFGLFNKQIAGVGSAGKNYAAGLSCYVTAIITKDQLPGSTLEFEKYTQKLGEAMDILDDYRGRSLPDAIFSISQFMQNNFQLQSSDIALPELYASKQFFNNGGFVENINRYKAVQSIPIDTATDSIVDFSSGSIEFQQENISTIEALMKSSKMDARDKAKSVFSAWSYYRIAGAQVKASELRGKLIHNPYFGGLVEAIEDSLNE